MTYIDRVINSTRPSRTLDPLMSSTDTYALIVERENGDTSATEIVTSGNVYNALMVAMYLARPSKGDVLILTWTTNSGDKRELSTKTLDFK